MDQLTEFIKPSTAAKLKALALNSKVELAFTTFLVFMYFVINQIRFLMARKNATYVIYVERRLRVNFEDAIDPPMALASTFFYLSQIFVWVYVVATYVYRNSNDFKFRFWNLIALYFAVIFAFPCFGMQDISYMPVLHNQYSNIFSIEAALLTLSVGYRFPNKPKYYYMLSIVPLYNLMAVFLMKDYVLSQMFALMASAVALNVPLNFIKENEIPISATYVPEVAALTTV